MIKNSTKPSITPRGYKPEITPLRPVGMCDYAGQRVECVAEGGYIDKGKKVKIIDVQSTQLTVRMIEDS